MPATAAADRNYRLFFRPALLIGSSDPQQLHRCLLGHPCRAQRANAQCAGEAAEKHLHQSSLAYRAQELMRNSAMLAGTLMRRDYLYHEPSFILKAHSGPCIATIADRKGWPETSELRG